jgi:4a-hydroxytetrahydrobiopterin dehydratase
MVTRSAIEVLAPAELQAELAGLEGWTLSDDGSSISRSFAFADFGEAFAFMTRVALYAERHDHHPEWFNVYKRVDMRLTTHDAGGVSRRDIAMAQAVNRYGK